MKKWAQTSVSVAFDPIGVLTSPGWIHVTLIPDPDISCLKAWDIPSTKNLVPEYTAKPGKPWGKKQTCKNYPDFKVN